MKNDVKRAQDIIKKYVSLSDIYDIIDVVLEHSLHFMPFSLEDYGKVLR